MAVTSNRVRLPQAVHRYRGTLEVTPSILVSRPIPTTRELNRLQRRRGITCRSPPASDLIAALKIRVPSQRTSVRYCYGVLICPQSTQPSFDDLGTPLSEVTFVVIDLETTGTSPEQCAITEVGAVKYKGGELLATFQTFVNPGVPIPPFITVLTGITEAMVLPAPLIDEVLPTLLEFIGGAVVVGHNIRFDVSFLDAALVPRGYPRLANRRVDTLGLARRLVRDEVPNLKLATLAKHLRLSVEPNHRALSDARATAELLHALLERAGTLGVLGLDDLLDLPSIRAHPSANKLSLTTRLPRRSGVYIFKDRTGRVLYVGKATNLRTRVRSYFSGDTRKKVPQLLRETEAIDWMECADDLESSVREARLIHDLEPRFNRHGKGWRAYAYLKFTLDERFPRLSVVREVRDDGAIYLGPLSSARSAQATKEAVEAAVPLRRCNTRIARNKQIEPDSPCVSAQLGIASCPCTGHTGEDAYAQLVGVVTKGLRDEPSLLLRPLENRMEQLTEAERFEEAADARDQLAALSRALRRQRMLDWLRGSGRVRLLTSSGEIELVHGRVAFSGDAPTLELARPSELAAREDVDELLVVARWLDKEVTTGRVRLLETSSPLSSPRDGEMPTYAIVSRRGIRRGR